MPAYQTLNQFPESFIERCVDCGNIRHKNDTDKSIICSVCGSGRFSSFDIQCASAFQ